MTGLYWYCKSQVVPMCQDYSKVKFREHYFTAIQNYGIQLYQQAFRQIAFFLVSSASHPIMLSFDFLSIWHLTEQADGHTYKGPWQDKKC